VKCSKSSTFHYSSSFSSRLSTRFHSWSIMKTRWPEYNKSINSILVRLNILSFSHSHESLNLRPPSRLDSHHPFWFFILICF
jgi:hypothetical protein